jgi:hypothetical protein
MPKRIRRSLETMTSKVLTNLRVIVKESTVLAQIFYGSTTNFFEKLNFLRSGHILINIYVLTQKFYGFATNILWF